MPGMVVMVHRNHLQLRKLWLSGRRGEGILSLLRVATVLMQVFVISAALVSWSGSMLADRFGGPKDGNYACGV